MKKKNKKIIDNIFLILFFAGIIMVAYGLLIWGMQRMFVSSNINVVSLNKYAIYISFSGLLISLITYVRLKK